MTKEEAIQVLKRTIAYESDFAEAKRMAIEALVGGIQGDAESAPTTDCISRQQAVEVAHKYFADAMDKTPHEIDEDGYDVYTDMKAVNELLKHNKHISKAIKALPPVTPTERTGVWISVSEGLPKEKQEVYVTVYFTEGDYGRAYGYIDGFGNWHLYSTAEGRLNSGYEVTAWMPLPEPYKGGDTE